MMIYVRKQARNLPIFNYKHCIILNSDILGIKHRCGKVSVKHTLTNESFRFFRLHLPTITTILLYKALDSKTPQGKSEVLF